MSNKQEVLKLQVKGKDISFLVLQKPKKITRSKNQNNLEKTSNPKKYRLLISKQEVQHHYHKFRPVYFGINSLDILISFEIKTQKLDCKLFLKLDDFFYYCTIKPDQNFLDLIQEELSKKNYSLKP